MYYIFVAFFQIYQTIFNGFFGRFHSSSMYLLFLLLNIITASDCGWFIAWTVNWIIAKNKNVLCVRFEFRYYCYCSLFNWSISMYICVYDNPLRWNEHHWNGMFIFEHYSFALSLVAYHAMLLSLFNRIWLNQCLITYKSRSGFISEAIVL